MSLVEKIGFEFSYRPAQASVLERIPCDGCQLVGWSGERAWDAIDDRRPARIHVKRCNTRHADVVSQSAERGQHFRDENSLRHMSRRELGVQARHAGVVSRRIAA